MKKFLFAPWRITYILGEKIRGCIFCRKPKEKKDAANLILERKKHCYVILNRYPYTNGHLMVVPYIHTARLEDLKDEVLLEMMKTASEYVKIMEKKMKTDGFNIGINIGRSAGAGIESHLHLHVVPRWNGDNNFMPVIGGTRVISESFESVMLKLKKTQGDI